MVKNFYLILVLVLVSCTNETKYNAKHSNDLTSKKTPVNNIKDEGEDNSSSKCLDYILDTLGFQILTNTEIVTLDNIEVIKLVENNKEISNWLSYHNLDSIFKIKKFGVFTFVGENVNATGFYVNFYDWLIINKEQTVSSFISLNNNRKSILKNNNKLYFNKLEFSDQFIETRDFDAVSYKLSIIDIKSNTLNFEGTCDKNIIIK